MEVYLKVKNEERTLKADEMDRSRLLLRLFVRHWMWSFRWKIIRQAVGKGADAQALAFVPLKLNADRVVYGVGIDSNIDRAAVHNYCRVESSGSGGGLMGLSGHTKPFRSWGI